FVGSGFLEEMAQFFVEFQDVLGGFRERGKEVFALLRGPKVGFVLVAAPEASAIDEALFFHARLVQASMPLTGFVVNRVHAVPPAAPSREDLAAKLGARAELKGLAPYDLTRAAEALLATRGELAALATADRNEIARLTLISGGRAPVVEVPFLDRDVHDV